MAGYSGTPLARKLGIREGSLVGLLAGPEGLERALAPIPSGASVLRDPAAPQLLDVIVAFVRDRHGLAMVPGVAARLAPGGGLWLAWPKRASGVVTDVGESDVRQAGLAAGLVDNKVCAIDDTWSGLRFVARRVR